MRNKKMFGSYEQVPDEERGDGAFRVTFRRCVFCGEWFNLAEGFAKNGVDEHGEPQRRYDCKRCYNIRRRENQNKKRHSDFIGGQKRRGSESLDFTHQERKECLIYFGGECAYCGHTPKTRHERLTMDHLVPVSRGGTTTGDNIVPACSSCNSSKNDMEFKEWFMKQSFFSQDRLNKIFKWRSIMRQVGGTNNE